MRPGSPEGQDGGGAAAPPLTVTGDGVALLAVRVRPGASRTKVGGSYGEGSNSRLVVAVSARAVDGAATAAVLAAVADALGLRPRQVTLRTGRTSRDKVLEVLDPPPDLDARVSGLAAL